MYKNNNNNNNMNDTSAKPAQRRSFSSTTHNCLGLRLLSAIIRTCKPYAVLSGHCNYYMYMYMYYYSHTHDNNHMWCQSMQLQSVQFRSGSASSVQCSTAHISLVPLGFTYSRLPRAVVVSSQ